MIPGKLYPVHISHKKQNHSLLAYIFKVIKSILGIQLKQIFSNLQINKKVKTLNSEFSESSLVILCHSVDLEQAVWKAQGYNIPLIQVVIRTPLGKNIIKEKVLNNFSVAHLINQNFVFYGD